MFFKKIAVLITFALSFSSNTFAQNKDCENSIINKYSGSLQDKYGRGSIRKISTLQYLLTLGPGGHKYGNNNALFYVVVVDKYVDNNIMGRDTLSLICIANLQGKILGIEIDYK